jgi:uncharacterized RDD family membrane protein YckC
MADNRFGGFWRRLLAFFIDKIILFLVSLILFLIGLLALALGGVSFGHFATTGNLPGRMGLFMAVYSITTFLTGMVYFTWFHGTIGQTPGKMLFGLRVIQISGEKMTLGIAFLRCVGYLVSGLVLWLGFIWIAFDGKKQGWHDKIAATLVIRVGNEPGAGMQPADNSKLKIHTLTDVEELASTPAPSLFLIEEEPAEFDRAKDFPSS